jgi:hypothetical protein
MRKRWRRSGRNGRYRLMKNTGNTSKKSRKKTRKRNSEYIKNQIPPKGHNQKCWRSRN